MGVKGLWGLLEPHSRRRPLYELRGEKVAIDLSGWVCDSQNVTDQFSQPRLYLRNLFFRTSYLIVNGITPIFVLEGEAPKLKQNTMADRNLEQYKRFPDTKRLRKPCTKRRHFEAVLSHCENLLRSMGLECVRGSGEAEAMCAHLNSVGMVSAVISQDSDCFVYGAIRVYRNFSVSSSSSSAANSGSVDVYDINDIKKNLDIGRRKMVALALLCGSDYNGSGVEGIGYTNAINFLKYCSDETVLDKLRSWTNKSEQSNVYVENNGSSCSNCGHKGNVRSHLRFGCIDCGTTVNCEKTDFKENNQRLKIESNIKSKILKNPGDFPNEEIIDEYLNNKDVAPEEFKPFWHKPDMIKFVKVMCKLLTWTEVYCVEKFLPLLTKWQLIYKAGDNIKDKVLHLGEYRGKIWIEPSFIKKKRNPKGIPCYEIVWKDSHGHYEGLIPDDQFEEKPEESIWTTVEPQELVEAAYPDLVETFLSSKKKTKPVKNKTTRKRVAKSNVKKCDEDINKSMQNLSISKDVTLRKRRKRKNVLETTLKVKSKRYKNRGLEKSTSKQRRISSFLRKKSISSIEAPIAQSNRNVNKKLFHNDADIQSNLDISNEDDTFCDEDLSNIIEGILERKDNLYEQFLNSSTPLKEIQNNVEKVKPVSKYDQQCSTPMYRNDRMSFFFENLDEGPDAFEKSIDLKHTNEKRHRRSSYNTLRKSLWNRTCNDVNSSNISFQ